MKMHQTKDGFIIMVGSQKDPNSEKILVYASRFIHGNSNQQNQPIDGAYGVGDDIEEGWENAVQILLTRMGEEAPLPQTIEPASDSICSLLKDRALSAGEIKERIGKFKSHEINVALEELYNLGYIYRAGEDHSRGKIYADEIQDEYPRFILSMLGNLYINEW